MRERGVEVELCDVDRIRELEPRLAVHDLTIGCYEPTGGHAQPLFVADGFVRAAERDGATLRLGTRVTRLRPDGQGWTLWLERRHARERRDRDRRLRAVGQQAHARARGRRAALALARPGRALPAAARVRPPGPIISDHAHELWIKPEGNDGHYLIGGRGGRLDRSPHQRATGQAGADDSMLETFAGELAHRFPGMAGGVWRGSWSSFYDFTPDGNPVIDFVPGRPNLITATGMSGHCFKLAPSLGLGTAELVVDGAVRSFDWSVFAYGRFARQPATASAEAAGPDDRRRAAGGRRGLALPRGGRRRQAARAGRRPAARRARAGGAGRRAARRSRDRARRPRRRAARRGRPARRAAGAQRALGAGHGVVAAGRSRGARPGLQRRARRARRRAGARGRGDPARRASRPRAPRASSRRPTAAAAAATRSRSRARSGSSSRARASRARASSASRPCSSTAATCPRPGDADTPADLPVVAASTRGLLPRRISAAPPTPASDHDGGRDQRQRQAAAAAARRR